MGLSVGLSVACGSVLSVSSDMTEALTTVTSLKGPQPNVRETFDDSCLSICKPLDPNSTDEAFRRKAEEIRRELVHIGVASLGQLQPIPVPLREQDSKSCRLREQQPQTKRGRNKISSPAHQSWAQGACTGPHGRWQTSETPTMIWSRVSV